MSYNFKYDVLVIGGGHAGCEAAIAAARMGARTCLITMDMNKIAHMSCNPAVGGIAKGQIVREIDALGGLMGEVTDASSIQFRMLNRSKGPAMWSPRAQCDRVRFSVKWRHLVENTQNLHIWQDEVIEIVVEHERIIGVRTIWGAEFYAGAVILTAGTFLNGLMHIGKKQVEGGRCAEPSVRFLSENIESFGIRKDRMKTGTPVRIDKRSVHLEEMEEEQGEACYHRFSYISPLRQLPQLVCWTCQTTPEVHEILSAGLSDSPLFNGQIQSIGPRYCPSIETKIVTFSGKNSHPLFLEPEGVDTNELYLNGFSSSLPLDVQLKALRAIPALRDAIVYRPGYAIEYDFFDPTQLRHTLESKKIEGLFFAGQVNGTTGYEEAAGQGLIAGINAALKVSGSKEFTLARDEAYIGVLIDDLVTKGVDEPYRMFTSRAEYRVLLRQDNADVRLTPYAQSLGLASSLRVKRFEQKTRKKEELISFCRECSVKPLEINNYLSSVNSATLNHSVKLFDLLTRPNVSLSDVAKELPILQEKLSQIVDEISEIPSLFDEVVESAEVEVKYSGYITRERKLAEKMKRLEEIKIQGHFDYENIQQISTEARQKLQAIQPETLAQASRIPGVSPSDISVLLVLLGR